jgi:hypothetical protein
MRYTHILIYTCIEQMSHRHSVCFSIKLDCDIDVIKTQC